MAWYDDILRSAGACPLREAGNPSSPCRGILDLGLKEQVDGAGTTVRWVTAAGWGNPDADLYIVGTTPKWHSADIAGPNYAAINVDRANHAQWFALDGFPAFAERTDTTQRETTRWTVELVRRWTGGLSLAEGAFCADMLLCPQEADPNPRRAMPGYRNCMNRHLLPLLSGGNDTARTVVVLGAAASEIFLRGFRADGEAPSRSTPVVVRRSDPRIPADLILSVSVMGAKMAGLNRGAWTETVLHARDQLRSSPA